MTRYFFDFYSGTIAIDDCGVELISVDGAVLEARRGAATMIREMILAETLIDPAHHIVVRDDTGRVVYNLNFAKLIKLPS